LAETYLINDAYLVSAWTLNNGSLTDSKSGYNLTAVATPGTRTDAFGVANGAADLNGSSQYFYVANANCPNLKHAGSFTWLGWFYADSLLSKYTGYMGKTSGDGFRNHLMAASDNSVMIFSLHDVTENYSTATPPLTGQWYLLVARFNAATNKKAIFFNKTKFEVDSTGTSGLSAEDADFSIGSVRYANPAPFIFDGGVCDVAAFNRALTDDEINGLVDGTLPGPSVSSGGGSFLLNFI
jgi:hypothetical protein